MDYIGGRRGVFKPSKPHSNCIAIGCPSEAAIAMGGIAGARGDIGLRLAA